MTYSPRVQIFDGLASWDRPPAIICAADGDRPAMITARNLWTCPAPARYNVPVCWMFRWPR